jgi:hypothetical protein
MKLLTKFERNTTGELWHFGNYVGVEMATKKPRAANRAGLKKSVDRSLLRVVHLGCCRDFLELRKGTKRSGFRLAGAAAGSGKEREGGHTNGSDNAEHGGSEVRFFGIREKNDFQAKIQGGPVKWSTLS